MKESPNEDGSAGDAPAAAYADPLHDARYRVKVFPLPPREDLAAHIRLMESFERRFVHTADGGRRISQRSDLDSYIEEKRTAYAGRSGTERELEGASLCIALLERGIRRAKQHIQCRMGPAQPDDTRLEALKKQVASDLDEACSLFSLVRRRRGQMDVDRVLDEMKGEPYKIFVSTLPEGEAVLEHFRDNRLRKAARAMRCIDTVAEAVAGLAGSHRILTENAVPEHFRELADAAKTRLDIQRNDPAFAAADRRLTVARNALMPYIQQEMPARTDHRALAQAAADPATKALLREAAEIIYDIAIVRVPREVSAADLALRAEQQSRLRAGRSM